MAEQEKTVSARIQDSELPQNRAATKMPPVATPKKEAPKVQHQSLPPKKKS